MEQSIEDQIAELKRQQEQLRSGTTCDLTETMKTSTELQKQIDLLVAQLAPDDGTFTGISHLRG